MSKIVIHIGTHKTATTTIQDMFWANAELLAEHGLIYPQLGRHTGHHGLVLDWQGMPGHYKLEQGSLEALAETYGQSDKTVFLSSEEFSRRQPLASLGKVRAALEGFDEIEVICTLRTQWQFLQSIYLEVSKTRVPPRPPQLVLPVIENGSFEGLWVDYNRLLDALEAVFAPEEITFFDFDTSRRAEGGIIGTLLRHLGIGVDAARLEVVNDGASNVSPMSLASWTANILAEPKPAPAWLVQNASEALKAEFGDEVKPCLFTREEFRRLKDHYDTRNAELSERRAGVQPEFAISEASQKGLTLFRNEIPSAYWVRMSRRLVADRL
ncbi:hypothetical protein ACFO5Z_15765 [Salipiger abyssi]|uniref:Sulfotransferase family protein n=2 Tax=Salipiger abyssi TaxID=1250539 RepID=A0A1P8V0S5_9RHOB|nr:hypothetical protein Ga0080574_TMP4934 [Salipiger abyssi]